MSRFKPRGIAGSLMQRLAAVALLAALCACDGYSLTTNVDEGLLPPPGRLLASPGLAPLAYHSRLDFDDYGGFKAPVRQKYEYWADSEILPNARVILRYGYLFTGQDELQRHKIRRNFVAIEVATGKGVDPKALATVLEKATGVGEGRLSRLLDQFLAAPQSPPLRSREGKLTLAVERRNVIQLQNDYIALSVYDDTFSN